MSVNDQMLLEAIRQKMLDDIKQKNAANAIYNIVGGSGSPSSGSGVGAAMGGLGPMSEAGADDPFDYLVDITRKDLDETNAQGKPKGWTKTVHRYRTPKGEARDHGKKPRRG